MEWRLMDDEEAYLAGFLCTVDVREKDHYNQVWHGVRFDKVLTDKLKFESTVRLTIHYRNDKKKTNSGGIWNTDCIFATSVP